MKLIFDDDVMKGTLLNLVSLLYRYLTVENVFISRCFLDE